ncbi:MAG: 50S ribosomal protein L11 methyltransferase [Alphaproteobacteria bacterium]|nr:50S ribosomal protein L11 methyltransferase [Alphaproteobacteria bacterium]
MMSSCWQVIFSPKENVSDEFTEFLEDFFEVSAQNYDDDGNDEYIGYCTVFDETEMLKQSSHFQLPPYKAEKLESSNWLKDYVIRFAPFETDKFLIYGIHESHTPQTDKIPLQIYAATAFGSDHHTTRSCLKAICDLHNQGFAPSKILDIGTGSGILSLAATSLWPNAEIIAVDIDDEAVLVTKTNAENNHLDSHIQIAQSNGYQSSLVTDNSPYDLILANILARPLLDMSNDTVTHLSSKGYAILSGFVDEQEQWVINAHQQLGLKLSELYKSENWRTALMQKE